MGLINKLTGQATYGSPDVSAVSSRQGIDEINPQIAYAMQIGVLPKNLGGTIFIFFLKTIWYTIENINIGTIIHAKSNIIGNIISLHIYLYNLWKRFSFSISP